LRLETDTREEPAAAERPRGSIRPYLAVAAVLFVLLSVQTINRQWSTDYWMYTATIGSLHDDLRHPEHDMTATDRPSERYTPYTVGLAAIERVTDLAPNTVLQLAAVFNLVVFLVAFELFVAELTRRRLVACFALLATLVMWGLDPWRWSGFLSLNSIGFELPWPATLVIGTVLLSGWALLRYDDTGTWPWVALVGVCTAFGLLAHPYTAGWGVLMLLALFVHRRMWRRSRIVPLAIAAVLVVVALVAWPYYPFLELGVHGNDAYSSVMKVMYRDVPLRIVAAVPGFIVVLQRFRRDRTDALALMLLGGAGVYAAGAVLGVPSLGRTLPLIMLAAHIGIGILVADLVERRRRATPIVVGGLAVCCAIGLVGIAPGLARTVPRAALPSSLRDREALRPVDAQFADLGAVAPGTVVVAERQLGLSAIAPAFGIKVVEPGYPSTFLDDLDARSDDQRRFLDARTSDAERRRIASRYGVTGVLCATSNCRHEFADGGVIASGPGWALYRFPAS
jgi:hypothetical protein